MSAVVPEANAGGGDSIGNEQRTLALAHTPRLPGMGTRLRKDNGIHASGTSRKRNTGYSLQSKVVLSEVFPTASLVHQLTD